VTHVDLTVVAQAPRLSPHREDIRRTVARLLALDERRVNVKATTEEKLGFTGEGKGIKAMAAVTALRAAVPPSPDEG
jgi:2-C-methyl-D-erythritol 4-phosphate cytidylyltransferase/2-C-methyl-D-erythritol 2,4-cyclodiphosphate synthase